MRKSSEVSLLMPLLPIFLIGMLPLLVFPRVGFTGLAIIGVLMVAGALAERVRAMSEYNEHTIIRGYVAPSEQASYLSTLKASGRVATALNVIGVGMILVGFAGLYWNW
jgi:putative Mn2+ efflux pump MntP